MRVGVLRINNEIPIVCKKMNEDEMKSAHWLCVNKFNFKTILKKTSAQNKENIANEQKIRLKKRRLGNNQTTTLSESKQ